MTARWFRAPALLLLLVALAGPGGADDEQTPKSDEDGPAEPPGKAVPVLDVGGHSGQITEMVFGKDGKHLYTVGAPGELREWDLSTGEARRVWRFSQSVWRIALSADGKRVAVAGPGGPPGKDGKSRLPIWLVDLADGKISWQPALGKGIVHHLAFAPDGKAIALSGEADTRVIALEQKAPVKVCKGTRHVETLAFDPSGEWLLTARGGLKDTAPPLEIWNVSAKTPVPVALPKAAWEEPRAAWSADGKLVAAISGGDRPSFRVWKAGDRPAVDWELDHGGLIAQLGKQIQGGAWHSVGVAFLPKEEVIACWKQDRRGDNRLQIVRFNLKTKRAASLPVNVFQPQPDAGRLALSPNGRFLAVTTNQAFKVQLVDLLTQGLVRRRDRKSGKLAELELGPPLERVWAVGWAAEGRAIAWGRGIRGPNFKETELYTRGLNLRTLEPLSPEAYRKAKQGGDLPDGWQLKREVLHRPNKQVKLALPDTKITKGRAFKDQKKKVRLIVAHNNGHNLKIVDPDTGKPLASVGGRFDGIRDLAVSPDERYLLVNGGGAALHVYDLARPERALLQIVYDRGEWIALAEKGYYAGTYNGARLAGWKVSAGPDQPAAFFTAERFRKRLYKPELIQTLLEAGSLEAALKKVEKPGVKARNVEEMLPPQVTITKAEPDKKNQRKWTITAVAEAGPNKKQPIESLKLLIDGRPLPGELSVKPLKAGQRAVTWEVAEMPAGEKVELKVLARGPDVYGVSQPREITVPAPAAQRPALHVVSVGMTYTGDKALDLGACPKNDATEIFKQFPDSCVGKDNLFGSVSHKHLLIDKEAGKAGVLAALAKVKKDVKPRDLLVFFYAGHGVVERNEFYLLTHGANLNALAGTALSGSALREALGDFPCQVLVLLDACHSGKAGEALRNAGYGKPATDEASRSLADEECSVTLIAAAMGHQRALQPEGGSHGFFTDAILKALKRSREVTHNKFNGRQYVHHLFGDVFDEVEGLTNGKQHPTLSLPWTVESYPVRQVEQVRKAGP
jgi:WD40 repeat protein